MAIDAAAGLAGGCQCGAVRYRLIVEPTGVNICHCRMCQKASGGPFMAFGGVRVSEFVVTSGALATFSSSDIAERGFCARCGTPLTYWGLGSDRVSVTLGSLDDPGAAEPQTQLGVESKVRWLDGSLSLPELRIEQWLAKKKIAAVHSHQHPDHQT
jgi:hypothetical protein